MAWRGVGVAMRYSDSKMNMHRVENGRNNPGAGPWASPCCARRDFGCNRRLWADAPCRRPPPNHPRPTSDHRVLQCFVCVRCKRHCVLQGFVRVDTATRRRWRHAKTLFFKGGVGNARRADRHNRHFVGVGHAPTATAENVCGDDLTEALKMTQHRSQIWHT